MSGVPEPTVGAGMETFQGDLHQQQQAPGPDGYKGKKGGGNRFRQLGARHLRRLWEEGPM